MSDHKFNFLFAGESWNTYATHTKGTTAYTTAGYAEGATELIDGLRSNGHQVNYLPNHEVVEGFPYSASDLSKFDAVILSDVPADALLLPKAVFVDGQRRPNRFKALKEYVGQGGALLMIGGYMSFAGFEGRARYAATSIADIMPVEIAGVDDRVEEPEGIVPVPQKPHAILEGLPNEWPYFLGYNKVVPRSEAEVLLEANGDPILAVSQFGDGHVAAFTSDCSPHWGSPEFMEWEYYHRFWNQLLCWLVSAGR